MDYSKSDWKLFQKKLPIWQEAYMEKVINEYIDLLKEPKQASEKFWDLKKRINKDIKNPGVLLTMNKRSMKFDIVDLVALGVISIEDLNEFSEKLISLLVLSIFLSQARAINERLTAFDRGQITLIH